MIAKTASPQKGTPEFQQAVNYRLSAWLDTQKDSPGKRLAYDVARVWDAEGEEAAVKLFRSECTRLKVKLWEQTAISDMVVAYRAKHALDAKEILS